MKENLLIVDDLAGTRNALAEVFKDSFAVDTAEDGQKALAKYREHFHPYVITDIRMPRMNGLDLIKEIRQTNVDTKIIVISAYGDIKTVVEAMKLGADDFIIKPFEMKEVQYRVKKITGGNGVANAVLGLGADLEIAGLRSKEDNMLYIYDIVKKAAEKNVTALIRGESGTGKELIAQAIHINGPRRDKPFVPFNCASLAEGILESELFGHEKGAFTGAVSQKVGKFELANTGTIFLDEIGDISLNTQTKLLRVLQERAFERVGGNKTITCDVRVVTATNQPLEEMIKNGAFRQDLYYRINVIPIFLPPLRERKNDIPRLVNYFIERMNQAHNTEIKNVSPEVMNVFINYSWPGNIRELENLIERACLLEEQGSITEKSLPPEMFDDNI